MPRPDPADEQVTARLVALGLGGVATEPSVTPQASGPATVTQLLAERLPPWTRGLTVAPAGAAVVWLAVVCAACVAVTAYVLLHGRPGAAPAPSAPLPLPVTSTPAAAEIVVDVGGRVRRPGLVSLPAGARVADALKAAGGPLRHRDIALLNLAARVADGQLLLVGETGAGAAPPAAATGGAAAPVNLNTATVEELDTLPGIGPVLAQRIVDWRTAHNGFASVQDLDEVSGIGTSTYADLAPLVTV